MKKSVYVIIFLLFSGTLFSQSSIEFKLITIGLHPDKSLRQNPLMYENRIDDNANFIFEPGFMISYQKYIYLAALSFQFSQGFYSDAAAKLAGTTNVLLKYKLFHKYKFATSIGLGPSLSYRKDWHDINQYIDNDGYTVNGKWQTKWMLGAELSFYYYNGNKGDYSLSFYHGATYGGVLVSVGYRYWINSLAMLSTDCNTCGNKYNKKRFKSWWKRHVSSHF